jgi:hypothetical protein
MISFDTIVGVLLGDVRGCRNQFVQHPQVRAGLIGGDLHRRGPILQRSGEQAAGSGGVPLLGQLHVDELPELVDRPVQVVASQVRCKWPDRAPLGLGC